jgi:iron complex outermembrane recepter protein
MSFTTNLVVALVLCATVARGDQIKGRVTDPDGRGIPSVSIVSNNSSVGAQSDPDGNFTLDPTVPPGQDPVTRLTFSSVGYYSRQFAADAIPTVVILQEQYYHGTDILVRGDRAQGGITPIAFEDFSAKEIKRDYTVGEFPLLLETTPNVFTYTDGGAPLGYSYASIRGFDDKRISTYINGVPLNDPEDQATYFVDLPDFGANIDDIQIQRGVGNSLYGDASFGGTINVATSALSRGRFSKLTFGYGEYLHGSESISDIYKQSLECSSGLIDGRWQFGGRFSKQKTGGYRENSWYDGWAYAFSLARLDANMSTELYVYGGPMQMHLAYYGASREAINANRRSNVLTYANETDNFNQPHYHLHNTWQIDDHTTLANTLYYIRGKGFYEQYKDGSLLNDYNIDPSLVDIDPETDQPYDYGDLVRRQWVYKNQYGWNPTLTLERGRHTHTLGGSFYYFESNHWGDVVWAQHIGGLLPPQNKFYQYSGKKWVGSFFVQTHSKLTERLSSQVTAQLRYQRYKFDQARMGAFKGYDYDLDWFFVSPRLGLSYTVNDRIELFTNFAISSRTPTDASIYDANDPDILPSLAIDSVNPDSTEYKFGDPLMNNERVYDFELGGKYRTEKAAVEVNLFWMDFRNEIIPEGGINPNTGLVITTNAPRSVHAGVELSATIRPLDPLKFSANFAYNYNRVKDYVAILDGYEVDFKDKTLVNFPDYLGNLVTDFEHGNWRLTNRVRLVGRRYMELWNVEALSLDPYVVSSLSIQYAIPNLAGLGKLTLALRMDNLGDKKYEASGYGGNYAYEDGSHTVVDGWAEYFVAPERSIWGQVQLEMF